MKIEKFQILSSTGLFYAIGVVLVVSSLAFSFKAFAGDETINKESIVQIHAEVLDIGSMSKFVKLNNNAMNEFAIKGCKEYRNDDPECDATGTKPVIATIEYSWARYDNTVIPLGIEVRKGDLITTELSTKAPRIIEKLSPADCEWTHPIKLMGSGRVECKNDEANGYEETHTWMKRYPLKHPTPTPSPEETKPTISVIELYKSKMNAKPVSDDESLKAVVPVKADVHTTDANHTEIDSKAISDGK